MIIEEFLHVIVPYIFGALEFIGVAILVFGALRALVLFINGKFDVANKNVKLQLAESISLGLEFKLAAEVIKSVTVRTIDEVLLLGAVVVLRLLLTFVIHWESEKLKNHD